MALRKILIVSIRISTTSIFGSVHVDGSTALIISSVGIFIGTIANLKPLDNSECCSDESESDKLTTV